MFPDSLLANLMLFGMGQVAAWGYLRTGRIARGVALMVGSWVLADVALLARFAYEFGDHVYLTALVLMQLYCVVEFALFVWGRARRRTTEARKRRELRYRDAFTHYLRNETEPASQIYRRMLRSDPWDVEAALSLATLMARAGQQRKARSLFRSVRSMDREGCYGEVIAEELERLRAASR